ncbi:hypothetical protein KHQ06_24255 [Nocardia tengchongensis]|uniref:3-hydroxyanthranilate 3,4-dioxygenase n=1 Tax=Nocardia tengchongensis TaxID=2055889 RepID=A0ABX8CKN7_9NOCA|nr:hypothetical protein [Nocardia tengchongensis]QVI19479.1 hypothetical protein KHQ06_24255 [Nocardia tengchongensis]
MGRRRMLSAFKTAAEIGNYADLAVLPLDVDPQVALSRNWLPQPFYHLYSHDTVIAQLSGGSVIRMHDSSVNYFTLTTGDNVYVPAGTPHRIEPVEEGVMLSYVPLELGLEGAVWYCSHCDAELYRLEWEHNNDAEANRVYATACARFNSEEEARTCHECGTVADEVDLAALGWTGLVVSEPAGSATA